MAASWKPVLGFVFLMGCAVGGGVGGYKQALDNFGKGVPQYNNKPRRC